MGLFPYQKDGVRMMMEMNGNFLLLDEAGLGKSCQSMSYARLYTESLNKILIVCPDSLTYNWYDEATMWLGSKDVYIVDGSPTPEREQRVKEAYCVIINYDKLITRRKNTKETKKSKYGYSFQIEESRPINQGWSNTLRDCDFKYMVVDEAQMVKNPSASRSKELLKIGAVIKHIGVLTATPVENCPADMWLGLHLIAPKKFPNYHEFARTYSIPKTNRSGKETYEGGRRLDELHALIQPYVIRRRVEDVLPDMPPLIKKVIPVELDSYSDYNESYKNIMSLKGDFLGKNVSSGLASLAKMRQDVARGKLKSIFEYLDNFIETSNEKILVFANHREIVNAIHDRYKDISVKIMGGMSAKSKHEAKEAIQDMESGKRILVGNIQSAGVGLTLTSARYSLFAEFLYNPAWIYQALKRNHRIGTKHTVFANFMVARNTIEEKIIKILDKKAEIASQAIDNKGMSDKDLLTYLLSIA